jgi:ATP-binding cassette subfamily F protein 3
VQEDTERRVKISLPQPTKLRTSGDLIHFQDVAFRYPKTKNNVVQGVTFTVGQSGRCSFIGANGEGKSTIAKLVLGELQPTSGTITRHPTMKIGYFSQMSVEELSALPERGDGPVTPLMHFMAYFAGKGQAVEEKDARSFLGGLGLPGKLSSHTPVKALSGGQKVSWFTLSCTELTSYRFGLHLH